MNGKPTREEIRRRFAELEKPLDPVPVVVRKLTPKESEEQKKLRAEFAAAQAGIRASESPKARQKAKEELQLMEDSLRQKLYALDEAAYMKRAKAGIAKKWTDPEARWFALHLVQTKILPKLLDSRKRQGRKESLESLYARFLVFIGEGLPPKLGTKIKTYKDTNLEPTQLAALKPKEELALDKSLKPSVAYTYSVSKLARSYGDWLERMKTSQLLDLCSEDAWEVGIRWRKGLAEMVENWESGKAAYSLGWRGADRKALRKRFNNACVSAGLRVGS